MHTIFVMGSINMDLVMETDRMPQKGESVFGRGFFSNQGGKGANQAVACAKLGGNVKLFAAVGTDPFGAALRKSVAAFGVDTAGLTVKDGASGVVMIILDKQAHDNRLIVDLGANGLLTPADFCGELRNRAVKGDIFISQLEVPLECVEEGLRTAKERGMTTILNPAPMRPVTEEILALCDYVIPNETEAESLTGVRVTDGASAMQAYAVLAKKGVRALLVTLGEAGVVLCNGDGSLCVPAYPAVAVDTTSAGDTFIGGLAVKLSEGAALPEAIAFGNRAASVTVTRKGAAASIPTRAEVQ
ncbi:MAG: ribokinase [Clostridiales bacterium]|jgi:ribokinase|nr:ribokinase [Clostridiales bacterium]